MDTDLFTAINRFADRTGWAHGAATAYATYGIALFAGLLLAAWWDARRAENPPVAVAAAVWAGIAPLISFLMVQIIGGIIDRARPTVTIPGTHLLLDPTKDFSFPSDHSTAVAAIAVGLILAHPVLRHRWYGWAATALGVLLGLSRIYAGAHYPSDVLAGFILGGLVAAAGAPLARRLLVPLAEWACTTSLEPLIRDRAPAESAGPAQAQ